MSPKGKKGKKDQGITNCCAEFNEIFDFFLNKKDPNVPEIRFFLNQDEFLIDSICDFNVAQCIINAADVSNQPVTLTCNDLANLVPGSIENNV